LVFFSFVIDAFSRRVVGWQFAGHMRTDLVLDAPRMALAHRRHGADVALIHHSAAAANICPTTTPRPCTITQTRSATARSCIVRAAGDGQRLFDPSFGLGADDGIELVPTRLVEAPDVTHIRYAVTRRPLERASRDLVGPAQPEALRETQAAEVKAAVRRRRRSARSLRRNQ
jgi:hypothetical protein